MIEGLKIDTYHKVKWDKLGEVEGKMWRDGIWIELPDGRAIVVESIHQDMKVLVGFRIKAYEWNAGYWHLFTIEIPPNNRNTG